MRTSLHLTTFSACRIICVTRKLGSEWYISWFCAVPFQYHSIITLNVFSILDFSRYEVICAAQPRFPRVSLSSTSVFPPIFSPSLSSYNHWKSTKSKFLFPPRLQNLPVGSTLIAAALAGYAHIVAALGKDQTPALRETIIK